LFEQARRPALAKKARLRAAIYSMIRKKPALALDLRVDTGFPKKSCPIKDLEHDGDST
jgi:hypothetical protein